MEDAEALRRACIEVLLEAYEDAGLRGLCHEGRFEVAVDRLRAIPIEELSRGRADRASRANDP